jgi:hypothetical protein
VTGGRADLDVLGSYLTALMEFVTAQRKAGRSREEIAAMNSPLKGFEDHGNVSARALNAVFDELAAG